MNWIDIIFFLVMVIGIIMGAYNGFWWQFIRFIFMLVALYATLYLHEPVARWLGPQMSDPYMMQLVIYLVVFISIYLILFMITWVMEISFRKKPPPKEAKGKEKEPKEKEPKDAKSKAAKTPKKGKLDRVFGGFFGLLKTSLICGTILLGISYYPASQLRAHVKNSALSVPLLWYTRKVALFMPNRYKHQLKYFIDTIRNRQEQPKDTN